MILNPWSKLIDTDGSGVSDQSNSSDSIKYAEQVSIEAVECK